LVIETRINIGYKKKAIWKIKKSRGAIHEN